MSLFARNLAKCGKSVDIESRSNRSINGLPQEVFTVVDTVSAIVKTVRGVSVFDETNTETAVTHELCMDWRADVTAENFISLNGKRLRILQHENCCENDTVLKLSCTERGIDTKAVNEG